MQVLNVNENEAGQRLDKLLSKYLDQAPKSFLYKMMRKKNITLNKPSKNFQKSRQFLFCPPDHRNRKRAFPLFMKMSISFW